MSTQNKALKGFTLLELMITVAIIGILASIAYPSYTEQVRETRRTNAQSDLVELASFMERFYTENFTYMDALGVPTLPFTESPKQGVNKYYDLTVVATASTFIVTATPKNGQDSDRCGTITINHTGSHGAALANCW